MPWFFLWIVVGLLWGWANSQWQEGWVERSHEFFPPEWRAAGITAELAQKHPLYRENDTQYWVRYALDTHRDEWQPNWTESDGVAGGRPVAWNSGLRHLLAATAHWGGEANGGEQGIKEAGHWLNPLLGWIFIGIVGFFLWFYRDSSAAVLFVALAFFLPALQWMFAFGRFDHHGLFALGLWLQFLGLILVLLQPKGNQLAFVALAVLGTTISYWVSATQQTLIGFLLTLSFLVWILLCWKQKKELPSLERFFVLWGSCGFVLILLFWGLEEGWSLPAGGLSSLHPVHAFAHLGSGLFLGGCLKLFRERQSLAELIRPPFRNFAFGAIPVGLALGLLPLVMLVTGGSEAHVWLNEYVRRAHDYITEFRSPLRSGNLSSGELWSTLVTAGLTAILWFKEARLRVLLFALGGMVLVALWQERWLGELAVLSCLLLSFVRFRFHLWALGLWVVILGLFWAAQWKHFADDPDEQTRVSLMIQVLGRDIALNISAHAEGRNSVVAMPFDFTPQTLTHPEVHSIGSFYWENAEGIALTAEIFSETDDDRVASLLREHEVDFLVVQPRGLGDLFAAICVWISEGTKEEDRIRSSLAWRLSYGMGVPAWLEPLPFSGTFPPQQSSALLYRVRDLPGE
ncbi:MAG: hypothetical protein JJT75_11310 [Opitutales bacterium]|nr:hypothetical protein [Opitutales bacterium]MCH8540889.1 hypothetical protein [Opitutales bacterium]